MAGQGQRLPDLSGENVTVEIRTRDGHSVEQYTASQEEVKAIPFLMDARSALQEGRVNEALESVMAAVQTAQGDDGVNKLLVESKAILNQMEDEDEEQDMWTCFFCSLSLPTYYPTCISCQTPRAMSVQRKREREREGERRRALEKKARVGEKALSEGDSILKEQGQTTIYHNAIADGSSDVCPHCGGLFPLKRMKVHIEEWCDALSENQ